MALEAETQLGGPLSLALQAAMDGGETLSVDLDRELKIRREAMERAINQINEHRRAEREELAAPTSSREQLAQQRAQSQQALMAHIRSHNPTPSTGG